MSVFGKNNSCRLSHFLQTHIFLNFDHTSRIYNQINYRNIWFPKVIIILTMTAQELFSEKDLHLNVVGFHSFYWHFLMWFLVGITIPPSWFITITIAIWTFSFIRFYSILFFNRIDINISVVISNIDCATFITIIMNVKRVNRVWISGWFICSGDWRF